MSNELRKIIFTEEEVQAAMVNHCLRNKEDLPQRRIEKVEITDDPEHIVTFHYPPNEGEKTKTVTFDRDKVGAALILYCKNEKIPLPYDGVKILKSEKPNLAMMINLDEKKSKKE